MEEKKKQISEIEAQERLVKIMNNSPSLVKLAGTEWAITALKPGTQLLIAEEAVKIRKAESDNFSDIIKQLAVNLPSMFHIMTLALLNDRDLIFEDERTRKYSAEYETIYTLLKWESKPEEWLNLIIEVMNLINIEVFFCTTKTIGMIREMALARKMKIQEQKQSSQEPNGGK